MKKRKIKWNAIEDYPNYEVSNDGDVRNVKRGKILKPTDRGTGYLRVNLYNCSNKKTINVHILVASAFVKDTGINPDGTPMVGKHVVNHKDHNRANNKVSNLEWCDDRYNTEYSHNKPVKCLETNQIFKSATEAENVLGLTKFSVKN